MAVKSILTSQTDFTGEISLTEKISALWRFNESAPDSDTLKTARWSNWQRLKAIQILTRYTN